MRRRPVETEVVRIERDEAGVQGIISACSIQEGTSPLTAGAGNRPATIAGWIKDQTAASSERVSTDPSNGQWMFHHHIARYRVHVGLDSGFSEATRKAGRRSVCKAQAFSPGIQFFEAFRHFTTSDQRTGSRG